MDGVPRRSRSLPRLISHAVSKNHAIPDRTMQGMHAHMDADASSVTGPQVHPHDPVLAGVRAIAPLAAGLMPLALTVGDYHSRDPDSPRWSAGRHERRCLVPGTAPPGIQMAHSGAPAAIVASGATLMVNMQMVLYGAAMRRYWSSPSRWWRLGAGHLMVSPVFAIVTDHHRSKDDPVRRQMFYLAAGLTLWVTWLAVPASATPSADSRRCRYWRC